MIDIDVCIFEFSIDHMCDILAFGAPTSTKLATTDSQGMASSSQPRHCAVRRPVPVQT